MASVTQRAREMLQPRGGLLNIKDFKKECFDDGKSISSLDNIDPRNTGLVVDYLSRFMLGTTKELAFSVSLKGARIVNSYNEAKDLLAKINGLDDVSIVSAIYLTRYDSYYRNGNFKGEIVNVPPNSAALENIRIMVERTVNFFRRYELVKTNVDFSGAYTNLVHSGEADLVTEDSVFDIKVIKRDFDAKHTLQLLIYYLLGKHSFLKEFENIHYLGLFNPRYNTSYIIEDKNISANVLKIVESEVIGYKTNNSNLEYSSGLINEFDIMNSLDIDKLSLDKLVEEEGLNLFYIGKRRYIYKCNFDKWLENRSMKDNSLNEVDYDEILEEDYEAIVDKELIKEEPIIKEEQVKEEIIKKEVISEVKEELEPKLSLADLKNEEKIVTKKNNKFLDFLVIVLEIILVLILGIMMYLRFSEYGI